MVLNGVTDPMGHSASVSINWPTRAQHPDNLLTAGTEDRRGERVSKEDTHSQVVKYHQDIPPEAREWRGRGTRTQMRRRPWSRARTKLAKREPGPRKNTFSSHLAMATKTTHITLCGAKCLEMEMEDRRWVKVTCKCIVWYACGYISDYTITRVPV